MIVNIMNSVGSRRRYKTFVYTPQVFLFLFYFYVCGLSALICIKLLSTLPSAPGPSTEKATSSLCKTPGSQGHLQDE